jgi:3-oxoacyl-[acyl-carrier-protein] synthase I
VAMGAVTPVGLRSIDTAFAHRAASPAMREAPLSDADGKPITMCFLPVLDPRLTGVQRAAALAVRALDQVALALGPVARSVHARLVLAVDERLGHKARNGASAGALLADDLATHARQSFAEVTAEVSARGAAAPGFALRALATQLASGAADLVLLGGVHSDYDPERIAELESAGRLFTNDNLDALIPGEAAAFVALMRPDVARRLKLTSRVDLCGVATAHEKARPDNDEPAFVAAGLTAALAAVLAPLAAEGEQVGWVLTDLTFETFRHFELQAAMTRTAPHFCDPQQVESPAQRMGHLGAAVAPLHLAIAAEAHMRGFAPHRHAISIAGSDTGERAVILLSAPA